MLEKEQVISLYDADGNEVLYQVLLTFESDDFNKKYVLLVPAEVKSDDEEVEVYAYSYTETEDGEIGELIPVESDEEWDMIEEVFYTDFGEDDDDFDFEDDDDEDEHGDHE